MPKIRVMPCARSSSKLASRTLLIGATLAEAGRIRV